MQKGCAGKAALWGRSLIASNAAHEVGSQAAQLQGLCLLGDQRAESCYNSESEPIKLIYLKSCQEKFAGIRTHLLNES